MTLSPQLELLVILFAICLAVWLILIIYRGRLEQEEGDVFRTTPERLNAQQTALLKKVNRLSIPMWISGTLMVLLLLASIGVWIYQGLLGGG